jgi:FecR protein
MVPVSRRLLSIAALAALSGLAASAQSVISTHSGVLHVSEGAVFIGDQPVNQKYGTFPDLKEKSVLRTELGRAEILLTPGVFLRVGENSAVKMVDNRLSDTRVEVLKGHAVVECDDPMKENAVTMIAGDYQVHVRKTSVMEFVSDPAALKVYHGEAEVELNGTVSVVKAGKMLPFTQALAQERFDVKADGDDLTRWSQERSEAVSVANVSAAKSLRDSGGSFGSGLFSSGIMPYGSWYYNPFYSMYTYLPMNGMFFNPYGYGFFSPYTVYQVYQPGYYYGGGGGVRNTGTVTSSGNRLRAGIGTFGTTRAAATNTSGRNSGTAATPVSFGNSGTSTASTAGTGSLGGSSAGGRSAGGRGR